MLFFDLRACKEVNVCIRMHATPFGEPPPPLPLCDNFTIQKVRVQTGRCIFYDTGLAAFPCHSHIPPLIVQIVYIVAGSYVDVPIAINKLFQRLFSRVLSLWRPGFDSQPGYVSLGDELGQVSSQWWFRRYSKHVELQGVS